jgi:hypothetical protein
VDFGEICQADAAIQGNLDAEIVNPISSSILKWLRLKVVSWRHDVQPWTANGLGLFDSWVSIVGLLFIVGMSLAKCIMETIAYPHLYGYVNSVLSAFLVL